MSSTRASDGAAGRLATRTALVTGASRGIGLAVASALVREGATVAMLARSSDLLEREARRLGARARPLVCDVRDRDAVHAVMPMVVRELGDTPDILVNNAGFFALAPVAEMPEALFMTSLETNLLAPFLLVRAMVPAMRARGSGHVVSIGSIADRTVFAENGAYAASKHGLRALHEVMRAELRGTGVRTTLVSPASTDTELWDAVDPDANPGRFTPRRGMLRAEAVADVVVYAVTCPRDVDIEEVRLSRS